MRFPPLTRRLLAVVCLALLLFALLTAANGARVLAVLTPICVFFELLVMLAVAWPRRDEEPQPFPLVPVVASRPPPVR